MNSHELRQSFYSFFQSKQHTVLPSSSLIPQSDPTLLFTNAGMVQFKSIFTGEENRPASRVVTIQKCIRAGGKHNDLDNVGVTRRHHTFFEMLGNFSFGDYFKKEAIEMAWEFITQTISIPPERLWVTIFKDDDEAYSCWKKIDNLPKSRIVRLGEADNFWQMGDVGPCGPCSEILIDQGEDVGCGKKECAVGCDCDRFLEIWNLVFMQYNRDENGQLHLLPKPSIDTGMGLERLAAVSQSVLSNYESDLFKPLLKGISDYLTGKTKCNEYGTEEKTDTSMRIISDHIRAITFMISDGVMPSNEGRGYVLRRIIRRAARQGTKLGTKKPFLHKLLGLVIDQMGDAYPELTKSKANLKRITSAEEERFLETTSGGLNLLEEMIGTIKKTGVYIISGEEIFKLYDTYGLPYDMIEDVAQEQDMKLDKEGFDDAMGKQRNRSRPSIGREEAALPEEIEQKGKTKFTGYRHCQSKSKLIGIRNSSGNWVESASSGEVELVLDSTPFYGESGGQAGDSGKLLGISNNTEVEIISTQKTRSAIFLHKGKILAGEIKTGTKYHAVIDAERRDSIKRNHTATHILHAILRKVLGDHVRQAGSLVTNDRLRFDFTHLSSVSKDELDQIEMEINALIINNYEIKTREMGKDEAVANGALAFFDDKYGEKVRVVNIGDFSKELCGGTHASFSGEIGLFKIVSENGIAAGVRRIEAVTGNTACSEIKKMEQDVLSVADIFKTTPKNIVQKAERMILAMKEKERELEALRNKLKKQEIPEIIASAEQVNGVSVISRNIGEMDIKSIRNYADKIREKFSSGIVLLGAVNQNNPVIFCSVSEDLSGRCHAGDIIKKISKIINGGGGGNQRTAQAGGSSPEKLESALKKIYDII